MKSGFTNETAGSSKWANFKDGKILTMIDGKKESFTHLEGELVDIIQTDETYNGEAYTKISLAIAHGGGLTLLGFPFRSGYGRSFCKICPNIDPKKPVKISGTVKEIEGTKKTYGVMFISQGGKHLKHFFTFENEDKKKTYPPAEEIVVGAGKSKQKVLDYTKQDDFFLKVLSKFLDKVKVVHPMGSEGYKKENNPADDVTEPIDDLLFD